METEIKKVEKYFKNKLISGDYEVVKREKHQWTVLIDGKYKFAMWIGNGDYAYGISDTYYPSYMFFKFTEKERMKGWSVIKEQIDKYNEEVVLKEKKKQYEDLKKELNIK